ncbi:MAG: ATP-binding protein [Planctomycetota bacterium]
MSKKRKTKAEQIRDTAKSGKHVDIPLKTSQKILARITDGIYRQPASALRELISNAYDADASKVTIKTDAPRFSQISVKDNGIGISPEVFQHLIENIGGSAKRTETGKELSITSDDEEYSLGGRKLIGKMGIGLFAVAQFTRHFLVITKCKGEEFRTVADITLGQIKNKSDEVGPDEITSGEARVWREKATNKNTQGTEVKLLDLLPRTQAELCSFDRWSRIEFELEEGTKAQTEPPKFHIGRMNPAIKGELKVQPSLPWDLSDKPNERFKKFVNAVRKLAKTDRELVDLESVCDNYLQMIWELSLACPLNYLDEHPFDLPKDRKTLFFQLENKQRGQATELDLSKGETPREKLDLLTPLRPKSDKFELVVDGIRLSRPILFTNQPKTANAIKTPLMFVGKCREEFSGKPVSMSRGPLQFEAYLFWTPKVLPKQHQGVLLRIGNAAGAPFDRTFMDYTVSEQTRLRQLVVEVFVHEGLDDAINLDRESYNFAHPHYQFIVKWLHSAIRQFTNRHKAVGKQLREQKREKATEETKQSIANAVSKKLLEVEVEDVVDVEFLDESLLESVESKRNDGIVAFRKDSIFLAEKSDSDGLKCTAINEQKAQALTQLLYGWGVLDDFSYEDQARLVRDILEIVLTEETR